jgi:mannose-6-phosphate isomerase-like protein (cupin superfamily)
MKFLISIAVILLTSSISFAEAPITDGAPGFVLWNSELIQSTADRLEKELGDKHMVYQTIGNYQGHSMYLVLRGKTGTSEVHETESDFYISVRGSATFLIGGELTEAEVRPRKQQRGKSVKGGKSHPIEAGDILHVPVAIPHQIVIGPDEPYMYILIKLNEEPITPKRASAL